MRRLLRYLGFATVGSLLFLISVLCKNVPPPVVAIGVVSTLVAFLCWMEKK